MTASLPNHTCIDDAWHGWWLEPGSGGEFRCVPEWRVLPRILEDYTFWFVRGGVATLRCGPEPCQMATGDLLLVPPNVNHSAEHDSARPLWVVTAHFTVHSPLVILRPILLIGFTAKGRQGFTAKGRREFTAKGRRQ